MSQFKNKKKVSDYEFGEALTREWESHDFSYSNRFLCECGNLTLVAGLNNVCIGRDEYKMFSVSLLDKDDNYIVKGEAWSDLGDTIISFARFGLSLPDICHFYVAEDNSYGRF